MDSADIIGRINRLRRERRAVILSHYYQRPEVQDIADFVGDSLELSRQAAGTDAAVIVFCGVHFMAESASILSPDKIVLLPEPDAGCPMADMVTAEALRRRKRELPGYEVVAYVNTSAEVKAESDICCTSANVVRVIESVPREKGILFIPDRNLGLYAMRMTGREVELWPGYCCVHEHITPEDIRLARAAHPQARVLAHPECLPEVLDLADAVASTSGMIRFAARSADREFIIATEEGLLHQLRRQCPGKEFYPAAERLLCNSMKMTTLEKVAWALETLEPRVDVPDDVRRRALNALERMLAIN
ncbi:MAG: quinolinate synthase NadA [Thermoanaerobacterales bacterium]|nr:quinolinate synthase NadA [Bacillota bacterium]MDI6907767.1 quinolinate synthase NadA [Thermoanaerobacterales bacterium]